MMIKKKHLLLIGASVAAEYGFTKMSFVNLFIPVRFRAAAQLFNDKSI